MTTQIETIDGIKYLVTRDEKGNIVRQAGAEDIPALAADPLKLSMRLLLLKDPAAWVQRDINLALLFIIRRLLD